MDINKEREAFELNVSPVIWKRIEYNAENNIYMAKSKYWTSNIIQAVANEIDFGWKMWQLAKAQAVQEGFVLVSKNELKMELCSIRDLNNGEHSNSIIEDCVCNIEAMIEAQEQNQ